MKFLLILNTLFLSLLLSGQNADEIIQKNLENSGGTKNWENLKSIYLKGEAVFSLEEKYPVQIYQKYPNLTKTIFTISQKKRTIEGFDGKNAYQLNFSTNKIEPIKNYIPENFESDLLNYTKKGFKITYISKEKIGSKMCHKISLKKDEKETFYYFDINSYFLVREDNQDEQINYDDFKNILNFKMPHKIESITKKDGNSFVLNLNEIKLNPELTENFFKN